MQEESNNKKTKPIDVVLLIFSLASGLGVTFLCLFLLVLHFHDYQMASDWITEGGPLPKDVFEMGKYVLIFVLPVGIYGGLRVWSIFFKKLGFNSEYWNT